MLTKILVTTLVILSCYFYLRYRRNKAPATSGGSTSSLDAGSRKSSSAFQVKWVAGVLIALSACSAISFFIYDRMDNQRLLTVKIINPYSGEVMTYQVHKGDLKERSFETTQRQIIRVSNRERIEVIETP